MTGYRGLSKSEETNLGREKNRRKSLELKTPSERMWNGEEGVEAALEGSG